MKGELSDATRDESARSDSAANDASALGPEALDSGARPSDAERLVDSNDVILPSPDDASGGAEADADSLSPLPSDAARTSSSDVPALDALNRDADLEADDSSPTDALPASDVEEPEVDAESGPEPPLYEGTCCASNDSIGCNDSVCTQAVCAEDAYCCDVTWDSTCALCAMGDTLDGSCMGMQSICPCNVDDAGPCCAPHPTPLCASSTCTSVVCALDPYCCETSWDTHCVGCAQGGDTYSGASCELVAPACGCEAPGPDHEALAEAWAPVFYHDTDDTSYPSDYITAFDYDGDTISSNNWENLFSQSADLSAVVYWSLIETTTHYYILYTDFHPRDWTEDCDPLLPFIEPCHENDMEGAMVMVKKDGSEWGSFVLLVTEAHNILHVFRNDPAISAETTNHLEDNGVTFEGLRHVELYVESKGHGVCALGFDGPDHCQHPVGPGVNPFPGGDGIVYRFKGVAEVPSSGDDQDVGYALVPFYDTIWQARDDICDEACTFDGTFEYEGVTLAKAFDGDTYGKDKANPPWAWDDPDDGPVYRGDFFFRPAHAVTTWLDIPGEVSLTYVHNPYLDEL